MRLPCQWCAECGPEIMGNQWNTGHNRSRASLQAATQLFQSVTTKWQFFSPILPIEGNSHISIAEPTGQNVTLRRHAAWHRCSNGVA
jgi:hypothetical protein